MSVIVDNFSNRLRRLMLEKGVKPQEVCNATGINKSKLSNYRSGKYKPNQATLILIADTTKELKETEKQIEALINLYAKTQSASVIDKLKNLEIKKEELQTRLEYYNKITPRQLTGKDIKKVLQADLKTLRKNDIGVKQVLRKFINKIVVEDNQIVVHYNLTSVLTTFAIVPSLPSIIKTIEI